MRHELRGSEGPAGLVYLGTLLRCLTPRGHALPGCCVLARAPKPSAVTRKPSRPSRAPSGRSCSLSAGISRSWLVDNLAAVLVDSAQWHALVPARRGARAATRRCRVPGCVHPPG